jgi:hypothetical protein
MRAWVFLFSLLPACASQGVRCDGHLQPVNLPVSDATKAVGAVGDAGSADVVDAGRRARGGGTAGAPAGRIP